MRKVIAVWAVIACFLSLSIPAIAQDTGKKHEHKTPPGAIVPKMAGGPGMGAHTMFRPNINFVIGTISNIDTSDPANIKLEVKIGADNATRVIYATPSITVTKITDVSELKTGSAVRIMTRKADDKEIAMNISVGDLKKMTMQPPVPGAIIPPKEKTKK